MDTFLTDLWQNIKGYYNDMISLLPKLMLAVLVFCVLYFIANKIKSIVSRNLVRRMDDPLLAKFIARVLKITMVILALMIVLKIIGLSDIAAGLITGASVSAIVIGFAFKDIGENFLAGIILAFNRPFRVGDTVELDGNKGKVVSLNMRITQIKTFDGKDIYIPNANVVKNPVVNYTIDGYLRKEFDIGLDYGADFIKAKSIIEQEMQKIEGILQDDKGPSVIIGSMSASTLNLTVQYWLDTFDTTYSGAQLHFQAINNVLKALDAAGFYLPGDIIELKNYNDSQINLEKVLEESNN